MFLCAPLVNSLKYFTVSFGDGPFPGSPNLNKGVSIPLAFAYSFDKVLKALTFSSKVLYSCPPILLGLFKVFVKKSSIIV